MVYGKAIYICTIYTILVTYLHCGPLPDIHALDKLDIHSARTKLERLFHQRQMDPETFLTRVRGLPTSALIGSSALSDDQSKSALDAMFSALDRSKGEVIHGPPPRRDRTDKPDSVRGVDPGGNIITLDMLNRQGTSVVIPPQKPERNIPPETQVPATRHETQVEQIRPLEQALPVTPPTQTPSVTSQTQAPPMEVIPSFDSTGILDSDIFFTRIKRPIWKANDNIELTGDGFHSEINLNMQDTFVGPGSGRGPPKDMTKLEIKSADILDRFSRPLTDIKDIFGGTKAEIDSTLEPMPTSTPVVSPNPQLMETTTDRTTGGFSTTTEQGVIDLGSIGIIIKQGQLLSKKELADLIIAHEQKMGSSEDLLQSLSGLALKPPNGPFREVRNMNESRHEGTGEPTEVETTIFVTEKIMPTEKTTTDVQKVKLQMETSTSKKVEKGLNTTPDTTKSNEFNPIDTKPHRLLNTVGGDVETNRSSGIEIKENTQSNTSPRLTVKLKDTASDTINISSEKKVISLTKNKEKLNSLNEKHVTNDLTRKQDTSKHDSTVDQKLTPVVEKMPTVAVFRGDWITGRAAELPERAKKKLNKQKKAVEVVTVTKKIKRIVPKCRMIRRCRKLCKSRKIFGVRVSMYCPRKCKRVRKCS